MKYKLYLAINYIIIMNFLTNITKYYWNKNKYIIILIGLAYFFTTISLLIGIFNDFNIITLDTETINTLDQIDLNLEHPNEITDSSKSIWLNYINLLTNDLNISLDNKFKNTYYFNNSSSNDWKNHLTNIQISNCYKQSIAHNKEVYFFIESFVEILDELDSIQKNMQSNIK